MILALNLSHVRRAFRTKIRQVSDLGEMPVAWEGHKFTLPKNQIWLRENLLVVSERNMSFGFIETTGLIQYTLFFPTGTEQEAVDKILVALFDALPPASSIQTEEVEIAIDKTERTNRVEEPALVSQGVVCTWRGYATKSAR